DGPGVQVAEPQRQGDLRVRGERPVLTELGGRPRGDAGPMICWSCEKNAGEGLTCAACGALQPPDPRADHFQVLGVERRFAVDLGALERRYKEMTRVLHPDRFARADARARRASLARSVQLNEAWRTL